MHPTITRVRSRLVARSASLLIRSRAHRWCPPRVSLAVYRAHFGGGRPDWTPAPGGLSWQAPDGLEYGVDVVGGDPALRPPVVVWLHGGGWFFGTRGLVTPYLEVLTGTGVAGLAPSYPLAPEARHPEPLHALAAGLDQLLGRADELGFDPERVVLAGDSAGAALALALASAVVDPGRARELGVRTTLAPEHLRGVLLACGVFQTHTIAGAHPWYAEPMLSSLWSLARTRRWEQHRVARDFDGTAVRSLPPTLVVSALGDPLHAGQSAPFVEHLRAVGVDVSEYVAPKGGGTHEFQFDLSLPSAQEALAAVQDFLRRVGA